MLTLSLLALAATLVSAAPSRNCQCKSIPGDAGWPTTAQWDQLNTTVDGRLIATNPIAHVCHDPTYDEAACTALRAAWGPPSVQTDEPAEFFQPYFLNQSCVPQTERERPCELGNYASYSIDVRGPDDVAAGLAFATDHNVRLAIKNTGHDWLGKNTGVGALSLWTHNLRTIDLIESYSSDSYNGPAAKIGAGVTGAEAVAFAGSRGYRFLTGNCPSVGAAGGFSQGGGYGPLSALYGLGAYNALEWEVVTANGTYLIASPTQNQDLYYAISGGGGGTYGVVLSLTARIFPEERVAAAMFNFNTTTTNSSETYWRGVETFIQHTPELVDQGLMAAFEIREDVFTLQVLLAADGALPASLNQTMQPLLTDLSAIGLTPQALRLNILGLPNFYLLYNASAGPFAEDTTPSPAVVGSRFFSRENIASNSAGITDAIRISTEDNHFRFTCQGFDARNPVRAPAVAENGATDGWHRAAFHCFYQSSWDWTHPWEEVAAHQALAENVIQPAIDAATPGDGGYLNEANHRAESDFQTSLYGTKYERLLAIKALHDPMDLFYATTAVGSEAWTPDASGRLCRSRH